jgi:DNA end-binding protein Ku
MRTSGRCALAKWAWKAKQYVVQVRPVEDGLVLQQLLYADEVRSLKDLNIEPVTVSPAELQLALQLIEQISQEAYDPAQHVDEEKKRILAAIDEKISGKQVVASAHDEAPSTAQVIDLMEALRASLGKKAATVAAKPVVAEPAAAEAKERKGAKRAAAAKADESAAAPAPARARAKK